MGEVYRASLNGVNIVPIVSCRDLRIINEALVCDVSQRETLACDVSNSGTTTHTLEVWASEAKDKQPHDLETLHRKKKKKKCNALICLALTKLFVYSCGITSLTNQSY